MKTKKEIFDYVSKQTWYKSFCTNCFKRACELSGTYGFDFSEDLIRSTFTWDSTPEGFEYWFKINNEYYTWYNTEQTVELTIGQIAEKFNIPVSKVRIKDNE